MIILQGGVQDAGKTLSEKSRVDQKLHYVDNFDQCPFEEYTIDAVTHNAVKLKTRSLILNSCLQPCV